MRAKLSPLVWYAGLYGGSAAVLRLLGFVLFLWLAHALPVGDYAQFGLLYALQTGLTAVAVAGVVEVVIGLLREHHAEASRQSLFAAANTYFTITAIPIGLCALLGVAIFTHAAATTLVGIAGAAAAGILSAFASLQAQLARLNEAHTSSVSFNFIAPLGALAGGALGFLAARSITFFFVGSTLGMAATLIALRVTSVGVYGVTARLQDLRPILQRISPFILMALLGWLSGYGNNYIVKAFFPAIEVARFTFALSLASVMQLVATALNQVWNPRFYRIVHEQSAEEVERRNRRFFRLQGWALGMVGAVALAVFPRIAGVLKGNLLAYASMKQELLLLFVSYVVLSPWWHCANYYLVHGRGRSLMRITVISSAIGVAAWVTLMALLGPIGVYWGFLVQMCVRTAMIVAAARKEWPVKVAWDGIVVGALFTVTGLFA